MSKRSWHPPQKAGETNPNVIQSPTKLVVKDISPTSPLYGQVAALYGGRLKQFHGQQQQNYALSPSQIMKKSIQFDDGTKATYTNQFGSEILELQVSSEVLTELKKKQPEYEQLPNWCVIDIIVQNSQEIRCAFSATLRNPMRQIDGVPDRGDPFDPEPLSSRAPAYWGVEYDVGNEGDGTAVVERGSFDGDYSRFNAYREGEQVMIDPFGAQTMVDAPDWGNDEAIIQYATQSEQAECDVGDVTNRVSSLLVDLRFFGEDAMYEIDIYGWMDQGPVTYGEGELVGYSDQFNRAEPADLIDDSTIIETVTIIWLVGGLGSGAGEIYVIDDWGGAEGDWSDRGDIRPSYVTRSPEGGYPLAINGVPQPGEYVYDTVLQHVWDPTDIPVSSGILDSDDPEQAPYVARGFRSYHFYTGTVRENTLFYDITPEYAPPGGAHIPNSRTCDVSYAFYDSWPLPLLQGNIFDHFYDAAMWVFGDIETFVGEIPTDRVQLVDASFTMTEDTFDEDGEFVGPDASPENPRRYYYLGRALVTRRARSVTWEPAESIFGPTD